MVEGLPALEELAAPDAGAEYGAAVEPAAEDVAEESVADVEDPAAGPAVNGDTVMGDDCPDFTDVDNAAAMRVQLDRISVPLSRRYDAFGKGTAAVIKDHMRATLSYYGVVDEETYHDVAANTPSKANEILAELAGLQITGANRKPKHHVPSSKLAKIFNDLHSSHEQDGSAVTDNESLTARDAAIFATRFLKLICFALPLFFMADSVTLERLRKSVNLHA